MIDERELREMLERRAGSVSATPTDAPKAIRRARRRLVLNAAAGTLVGLAVLAGALAGVRTIQAAPTPADSPTPAPTPARLGSLAYAVDGDIFVAEWDGSNPVRVADGRPPSDCGNGSIAGTGEYFVAAGPIWSPDGRYLAYRHADCDGPRDAWWDVVISDREGNVVTSFPSEGWGISWSPDSTRVAVWVSWGEEPRAIGVYGLDGVRQALLTRPPEATGLGESDPGWSGDGESILFVNGAEVPLEGAAPRQHLGVWPTYSPDGSRVAYLANHSVIVAAADGSSHREMFKRWAMFLTWSPTGERIAFVSHGFHQLRVLDLETGTVTLPIELDRTDILQRIDFSAEGDRILFSKMDDNGAGPSSLWSVNVDGSDLRRLVTGTAQGDWFSPSQTR
jgi:Tol biopolymer transport system component